MKSEAEIEKRVEELQAATSKLYDIFEECKANNYEVLGVLSIAAFSVASNHKSGSVAGCMVVLKELSENLARLCTDSDLTELVKSNKTDLN